INGGALNIATGVVTASSLMQYSTGSLTIGVSGPVRGLQYGTLLTSGPASLAGNLSVTLNGFTPVLGNYFDIFDWDSRDGVFSTVALPALGGTLAWNSAALYTGGTLSIIDTNFLPGDFDRDGQVSVADVSAMTSALADLAHFRSSKNLSSAQ